MLAPMLAPLLKPWLSLDAVAPWPLEIERWPSALAAGGRLKLSWAPAAWLSFEAPEAAAFAEDWDARAMETQLPALDVSATAARAEQAHDEFLGELPALNGLKAYRP